MLHANFETSRRTNALLWAAQIALALIFLFAGGMKLVMPIAAMTKDLPMPGWFLRGLGVVEVLGGVGVVLPWLTRIRPMLTPLAALGLVPIMIGATVLTLAIGQGATAIVPAITGLLALAVALGRSRGWRETRTRERARLAHAA